jgi:hypothetical protein
MKTQTCLTTTSTCVPFLSLTTIVLAVALASRIVGEEPSGQAWDTYSDTWVATDGLGRKLPTSVEVGLPRDNKTVGIFYFLWLGRHGEKGPFDISKILRANPTAIDNPLSPAWGALGVPHHWGESLFGYYVSDDHSVLRKHAQMLSDAGIDMVVFDVTNQLTYPESWQALCKVWDQMRRDGNRVPQIAFLAPFGDPNKVVHELWMQLYQPGTYEGLWFRWEGKPLILADPARVVASDDEASEIHNFFTFRKPQPSYFVGPTGPEQWGWLEVAPQHTFYKTADTPEQITVGVAQNALDGKLSVLSNPRSHGRSFHDSQEPAPEDCDTTGRNFSEQWERAFEVDPPFVFVTGWNEWIAGRFDKNAPFYGSGPVTFVDQFDQEFSRDCEPMKGGHGDNYYYQLASQVRRYKGTRLLPSIEPQPISIDGNFEDWQHVLTEFRDTIGDPVHRNYRGWGKETRYVNDTGRNDIISAKVSFDDEFVYMYVRTQQPLTAASDPNWMQLLIDSDRSTQTGWLGYDWIINRQSAGEHRAMLERHEDGFTWGSATQVAMRVGEHEIEVAVPRSLLNANGFDFKWTDNSIQDGEWTDFTLNGDVAPNDRFNYRANW